MPAKEIIALTVSAAFSVMSPFLFQGRVLDNDRLSAVQSESAHFTSELKEEDLLQSLDLKSDENYFCIASCEALSLYACQERETGVICLLDNHAQYFNWRYRTPRQIPPQAAKLADGSYACILNVASGTGIQLYELHLLKLENGRISDSYLSSAKISEAFENVLTDIALSAQTATFQVDGKPEQYSLAEYKEPLTLVSVSCGQSINEITITNGLTVRAAIELHTEETLGPVFAGSLQANINVKTTCFSFPISHLSQRDNIIF